LVQFIAWPPVALECVMHKYMLQGPGDAPN
jgi:hypothetical protein